METSANIQLPVKVGDVLWMAKFRACAKQRRCSICKGRKSVWVVNVEGEEWEVACESCGKGFDASPGVETYYDEAPEAVRFEVASIPRVTVEPGGVVIELRSTSGDYATFASLYADEAAAWLTSVQNMRQRETENMTHDAKRNQIVVENHAWSVRYHQDQIKDAERRMAWHRGKLLDYQTNPPKPRRKRGTS